MVELTKEYFDERMTALTQDVGDVRREVGLLSDEMFTKEDAAGLRSEMNTKFDALFELLDVRKEVDEIQKQVREVRQHLNLA